MVDILMATYNGAEFLTEQLQSILTQTHKEWRVLIHDDGSADETCDIAKRFAQQDSRVQVIEDGKVLGGAAANFLHLLGYSTAPYIIFCDQDDIWLEEKLDKLVKAITPFTEPCAVYCNAYGYDGQSVISDKVTMIHRHNLQNSLFLNSGVQGCSTLFNRALLESITPLPDYVYMHDHLITLAAVTFGQLLHIDESLMLYRQHANNVTGNIETSFTKRVLNFFFKNQGVIDFCHFKAVQRFYKAYRHKIDDHHQQYYRAYFKFAESGLVQRLWIVTCYNFKIGESRLPLLIKTLIRKPLRNHHQEQ